MPSATRTEEPRSSIGLKCSFSHTPFGGAVTPNAPCPLSRRTTARTTLLTAQPRFVLLQIIKIATFLRRMPMVMRRTIKAIRPLRHGLAGAHLVCRLDHVAIGSPGHHTVLQLAGARQFMREPDPDDEQDGRDEEAGDRAAPAVALFWFGHRAVTLGS